MSHNWLRVSQGCQICLKSFVGMTFADFRRDPLEFPIFGGRWSTASNGNGFQRN